ncbi:uncharacterized protein LOC143245887 [Tachypleus tridentatus]|uniref:uncharacterized protein LOC143245887 n=1 Tax=Tachypleus tridentatus TaxID=6853 RepID=UPI003FD41C34
MGVKSRDLGTHFLGFTFVSSISSGGIIQPNSERQTTHEGCDGSEFATCMNQSFSVNSESPVGGLAGSLKDLELSCRKFYKGMECMERFHEQCRNSAKFMDYIEKQIEGARAAMFHLCHNEATIQEGISTRASNIYFLD